jgi:hypothetical protein
VLRPRPVQVFSAIRQLLARAALVVARARLVEQRPTTVHLGAVTLQEASHLANPNRRLEEARPDYSALLEVLTARRDLVPISRVPLARQALGQH